MIWLSDRIFIDTNKLEYFDAPFNFSYNENQMKELNRAMIQNHAGGAGAAIPHYNNKISFVKLDEAYDNLKYSGGMILDYNAFNPFDSYITVPGYVNIQSPDPYIIPEEMGDWVVYYELAMVNKYPYWGIELENPPLYDNMLLASTGFRFTRYDNNLNPGDTYTPIEDMGKYSYVVRGSGDKLPTPTHNYDNWLYVKNFKIYKRPKGDTSDRYEITETYPCVVWDLQSLYLYRGRTLKTYGGNYQSISLFNPDMYGNRVRPLYLWQSCAWGMFNTYRVKGSIAAEKDDMFINSAVMHDSTIPNTALLGVCSQGGKLSKWFGQPPLVADDVYYWDDNSLGMHTILAFKTEQDFVNLLLDWGLTHYTNNEDEAKTMPVELFPDNGFVPDGGDSSGYDDNPTIPDIPSFADNTSDVIDINTPNISSANAANVYALSLTATQNFLTWLITDSFIDNISNLFNDKLSALNDLKLLPFDVVSHDTAHTAASDKLTLANVSTNIPCHKVQAGYNCILDGGKYHYTAYWGNYNDYTAATYYLYIPYGGIVELSPSHVVNCDLSIKYAVDLMTGNATAVIYSNGVLVKTVPCQMSQPVPITFTNTNQRDIKNALTALSAVSGIGGVVANAATGNIGGAVSGGLGVVSNVVGGIATNPLKVGSIGNFSSSTAFAMPQNAFLIISRAQLSTPSGLAGIAGRPSNIYTTINSFVGSGFVQINVSHINTAATTDEQNQILNLLRGGIFI